MAASFKSFSEALPQAKFVDIADAAMQIRRVKSLEEIEVVRQGSRIAELGAYAAIKALHEGVPEYETTLASTNTMVREIAETYPHIDIRDSEFWILIKRLNLHTTQVAHQAETYPGFCNRKRLGVFLLPPSPSPALKSTVPNCTPW